MRIIGILASGEAAGFLEAALIDRWQRDNRCQNSATGGEGISLQEGPFCVRGSVHKMILPFATCVA